jgi:hypothetical protein
MNDHFSFGYLLKSGVDQKITVGFAFGSVALGRERITMDSTGRRTAQQMDG